MHPDLTLLRMCVACASSRIMDDLVAGKPALAQRVRESMHWKSWEELVTLVRFVLRHRFSRSKDPDTVQELYDSWMRSVERVPQWKGYWKPKHHLPDHLKDALIEHGPFRAYWCMWGEAFLQYLKRLFEVSHTCDSNPAGLSHPPPC
jgi:hypothetical protein